MNQTGVRDPDGVWKWLVLPWPPHATFCEVVRHFLRSYVSPLQSDPSAARQLAYFRSYQAALENAAISDLTNEIAWRWRTDLLDCITCCVDVFAGKAAT
jgi:hypothetical protein